MQSGERVRSIILKRASTKIPCEMFVNGSLVSTKRRSLLPGHVVNPATCWKFLKATHVKNPSARKCSWESIVNEHRLEEMDVFFEN